MKLGHFLLLILLVSVLLYQGLKNPNGVATIFNAGGSNAVKGVQALQGR
jgi:hypothetical protein